jgi:uncharacterized membrane protein
MLKHLPLKHRTVLSLLAGGVVAVLLPGSFGSIVRILCTWDAGMLTFLVLTWLMMARATPQSMQAVAEVEDEGRLFILGAVTAAACASLLAIGFLLVDLKDLSRLAVKLHVALAVATIVCSWFLVHTVFTLHYAYGYYQPDKAHKRGYACGLGFPHTDEPDYWDFLYFSFVIGMTSQVSDVAVTSRPMRRLALLHGVLAFFFNTSLLAMGINILASLLGSV